MSLAVKSIIWANAIAIGVLTLRPEKSVQMRDHVRINVIKHGRSRMGCTGQFYSYLLRPISQQSEEDH